MTSIPGGQNQIDSTDGGSSSTAPSENATSFLSRATDLVATTLAATSQALLDEGTTSKANASANETETMTALASTSALPGIETDVSGTSDDVALVSSVVTMVTEFFQESDVIDGFPTETEGHSTTESWPATKTEKVIRSGHDLPVVGLAEGHVVRIHSVALACIAVSFCCASAVIIVSFRHRRASTFFKWNKTDRLVIYLALCDWFFHLVHFMDHGQVLVTFNHVNPPQLCLFYAYMLVQFVVGQILLVNVTAIDICVMLFANKRLNFGRWDWRVLSYIIGGPAFIGFVCLATNQLGFNGVFCFFDSVSGKVANMVCTTVLFWIITLTDTVLYIVTWIKLHREAKSHMATLGPNSAGVRATHKAAKNMSMLVLAYLGQWWILGMYGVWLLIAEPPMAFYQLSTSFANLGGLLNGIVFALIRRRMYMDEKSRAKAGKQGEAVQNGRSALKTISLSSSAMTTNPPSESSINGNHI